jgi:nucleoside-diphosphate-sugar epimerase
MRVLVIGGTGFIGRHVTRRLIQAGHEVTVFHRGETRCDLFNVGEPDALTEKEWVQSIGCAAGWNGEVVTLPKELMPEHLVAPYNFEHQLCCDTGRIREELGYSECVSRDEAMKKTVEWERALPPGQPPDQPPDQLDPEGFYYGAEDEGLAKLAQSQR